MASSNALRAVATTVSSPRPSGTSHGTRAILECEIRRALEARDLQSAATLAIKGYGPEIERYLAASAATADAARESYSQFTEDLWKGLPGFRWRSSFRTWAYTLARHALYRRHSKRTPAMVPLSCVPPIAAPEVSAAENDDRERLVRLLERLSLEDRTLFTLRVDRRLSWGEIARVISPKERGRDAIKRKAAALRKRFERLKQQLRTAR